MDKILKAIKYPNKTFRYILLIIKYLFRKKEGTLFFLGIDPNGILFPIIISGYKKCYGFEPNPERYRTLCKKYNKYSNVYLYNVALAKDDGEINFNITDNDGASSSIGEFDKNWEKANKIKVVQSINIPSINLYNFCKKNHIESIDNYISDIQGMDLEVLKTMQPMIENMKINTITCEVTKNGKRNIYYDLPDNSENGFQELLKRNYELIAKGNGILKDDKFDRIPDHLWEMDCKWRLKNN